jgi:hypothetical protein
MLISHQYPGPWNPYSVLPACVVPHNNPPESAHMANQHVERHAEAEALLFMLHTI